MRPHSNNLHRMFFFQDLINQTMLNVDPPGIGTAQIANQSLKRRRCLEGVLVENG
jgi:hypothetical protein